MGQLVNTDGENLVIDFINGQSNGLEFSNVWNLIGVDDYDPTDETQNLDEYTATQTGATTGNFLVVGGGNSDTLTDHPILRHDQTMHGGVVDIVAYTLATGHETGEDQAINDIAADADNFWEIDWDGVNLHLSRAARGFDSPDAILFGRGVMRWSNGNLIFTGDDEDAVFWGCSSPGANQNNAPIVQWDNITIDTHSNTTIPDDSLGVAAGMQLQGLAISETWEDGDGNDITEVSSFNNVNFRGNIGVGFPHGINQFGTTLPETSSEARSSIDGGDFDGDPFLGHILQHPQNSDAVTRFVPSGEGEANAAVTTYGHLDLSGINSTATPADDFVSGLLMRGGSNTGNWNTIANGDNNHFRWSLINAKFQDDGLCYFGKWRIGTETSTTIGGINLRRLALQNGFAWNPVFSDTTGTLTDAVVRSDIQWDTVDTVGASTELVQQLDFTDIDNNAMFDVFNDGDTTQTHPTPVSYTHLRAHRDRTRSRMPSSA